MPYTPVTFGTLARPRAAASCSTRCADADRTTGRRQNGAVFEDVGLWKRARYFPRAGEDMHAAVARECRTVRSAVGIFDASTLGKIEVVGPDAAEFLNRLYINAWQDARGRPLPLRHAAATRRASLSTTAWSGASPPDRFHVTTTTGGAARVLNMMEDYLQTEFPNLKVWLTSTTEQWAVIAVQGPRAREVIAPLVAGIDLSAGRCRTWACAKARFAASRRGFSV